MKIFFFIRDCLMILNRSLIKYSRLTISLLIILFFLGWINLFAETWNIDAAGNWNTASNWDPASVPNSSGATASFDSIITAPRTITVDGTFSVGTLAIDNANAYTLSGGTLNVNGIINITNTNGNAAHSISSDIVLTSDTTVTQNSTSDVTISGTISGSGMRFTKEGSETLVISDSSNSYSGGTTVNAGVLQGTPDSIKGDIINNANVTFTNWSGDKEYSNSISGTGSLTKNENSGLTISGTNSYSGGTRMLGGGILSISAENNLGDVSGDLSLVSGNYLITASFTSNRTINVDGSGASISITPSPGVIFEQAGTITGTGNVNEGSLRKFDEGTLVLSGVNDFYVNNFRLFAGTVQVSSDNNLGDTRTDLKLRGGTLNTTASFTSTREYIFETSGTISVDDGTTLTISGTASSTGGFNKSGLGSLVLSGDNTYSGDTTLLEGTLTLAHKNGAGSGTIAISDGATLGLNSSISASNNITLAGTSTINIDSGTGTLSGILSSTGNLEKNGSGILSLSGDNTYSGGTTLSVGTLTLAHKNGAGTGTIAISDGATLNLNSSISASNNITLAGTSTINVDSGTGTLSGILSSTGNLEKNGSGTLNLSGSNTYTGTTLISTGTIQTGSTSALSSSSAFTVDAALDVDHSNTIGSLAGSGTVDIATGVTLTAGGDNKSTIFSGNITGDGNFTKDGIDVLILSGDSDLTGTTTVNRGILDVRGSLSSSNILLGSNGRVKGSGNLGILTVNGGTISGNGTYNGIVLNSGTISPGDSVGTINIAGDYSQADGAIYEVEIEGSTSDKIIATGSATIDTGAILRVQTPTGSLYEGTTYDILTASGGINQLWGEINYPDGFSFDLNLINGNTIAQLTLLDTILFVGKAIDPGNPMAVKNYLQDLNIQPNTDLKNVVDVMDALNDSDLNAALNKLHPGLFGAFELANLDNNALIASILSDQMIRLPCSENTCSLNANQKTKGNNLWLAPFGNFTNVNRYQQLRGFDTYSGGLALGYDRCLEHKAIIGTATGYEYTRLSWNNSVGHADIHKVFGALYGSYNIKRINLITDISFLGGGNFYDVKRKIVFSSIDRTAMNNHTDYFFTTHLRANLNLLKAKENSTKSILLNLFGILDYFYLYQPKYKEHGAQSLNLEVKNKSSNMMRSDLGINIAKDIKLSSDCMRPYLSFSWVRKFRINGNKFKAQFVNNTEESYVLKVDTFSKSKDFFSPEAGVIYTKKDFTFFAVYKGEFASNYFVNQAKINFQWTF